MNSAPCSNGMKSNMMNNMCGIDRKCSALSGLEHVVATLTQGVALGWFVVAPAGLNKPAWGIAPGSWFRQFFPALKGRNIWRVGCAALSGLEHVVATLTQGVALGQRCHHMFEP